MVRLLSVPFGLRHFYARGRIRPLVALLGSRWSRSRIKVSRLSGIDLEMSYRIVLIRAGISSFCIFVIAVSISVFLLIHARAVSAAVGCPPAINLASSVKME